MLSIFGFRGGKKQLRRFTKEPKCKFRNIQMLFKKKHGNLIGMYWSIFKKYRVAEKETFYLVLSMYVLYYIKDFSILFDPNHKFDYDVSNIINVSRKILIGLIILAQALNILGHSSFSIPICTLKLYKLKIYLI